MKEVIVQFKSPEVKNKEFKNDKLHLLLNDGHEDYTVIISKTTDNKFQWNDVGMMKRTFEDIDSLMWEFELPSSLESDIRSLKAVSKNEKSYINDKVFDYEPNKKFANFMKQIHNK